MIEQLAMIKPVDRGDEVISIARQIAANAERVNKASRDRLKFMEDLISSSASVQSDLLTLKKTSDSNAEKLNSTVVGTLGIVREIEHTVVSLRNAVREVARLSEVLESFRDQYRQTSDLAENITNIARQTQMLSLNALIEASRSGGKDRAFSAVAMEFKELAGSSGTFAREITTRHADLNEALVVMTDDFTELGASLGHDAQSSASSLSNMQDICVALSSSVAEAEQASARAISNLMSFSDLASRLDKVREDTQSAITGSRENFEKAKRIESILSAA